MALPEATESLSNLDLLSAVLRILAKCSVVLDDDETQHSCTRLQLRCLLVAEELERVRAAIDPCRKDVLELLNELVSFVTTPAIGEPGALPPGPGISPSSKLVALHSQWLWVQERSSSDKQKWLATWLDYTSRDRNIRAGDALQRLYDECQELHPESPSISENGPHPPKRTRPGPPDGVTKAAGLIFEALQNATACPCHPSYEYDARLCIATHRQRDQSIDAFQFDLLLTPDLSWQEAQVGVAARPILGTQLYGQPKNAASRRGRDPARKEVKELCKPMTWIRHWRWRSHRLNFSVEEGKLWSGPPEKQSVPTDLWGEPISLEDFISSSKTPFTDMTKRVVAVLLGYAVLHLQGTRWIQPTWGPSQVLFQSISSTIPIKPYIQVSLATGRGDRQVADDAAKSWDEDDFFGDDGLEQHPLPSVVMLAIMLMQIYLGRTLRSFTEEFGTGDPEVLDNNDRYALAALVFSKYSKVISFSQKYWSAIDKCLDPYIQEDDKGRVMDTFELRKVLYDEIVGPLEDELDQGRFSADNLVSDLDAKAAALDLANWGQEIALQSPQDRGPDLYAQSRASGARFPGPVPLRLRPAEVTHGKFSRAGHRGRTVTTSLAPPMCREMKASGFFDDRCPQEDMSQSSRDAYLLWKQEVLLVYDKFLAGDGKHEAAKIAILDTGLDLDHPDFQFDAERRQRIRGYRNFTESASSRGADDIRDESGHGTHTAGLLLDFSTDASVFIAKIAEHDPAKGRFVAEAIRHAVDTWGVDIISMSFGFATRESDEYDLIEQAVDYAHSKGVLLFAAASNNGANQRRTFPARHDHVVCVHSTAADGVPSRFNPPPDRTDNFATLGEAVESAWPTHLCHRETNECCLAWKSGTSFATPIAAGIAAFLLQYARENLDPLHVRLLKKPRGMRAVLKEISLPSHGYDYLAPRLHPDNLFGKSKDSVRCRMSDLLGDS